MVAQLLDALPDALLAIGEERVTLANQAAARMLGRESSELVGERLEALLAPGEPARLSLTGRQLREGWELPATFRLRFLHAAGVEIHADVRFGWRDSAEGRQLLLSARDVTETRRAELLTSKLADLSARASTLMDRDDLLQASEPIFVALGWQVGLVEVRGDRSIVQRLVAASEDAVGNYGKHLLGREVPLERFPLVAHVARSGEPLFLDNVPAELFGPVRDAAVLSENMARARLTRSAWAPVWRGSRVDHVLSVIGAGLTRHDFVAIQLFAAQLSAASQLGELRAELVRNTRLAAVGEMSAVLAHEVRNPLGVIFNAVGGLRRVVTGAGEDTQALLDIVGEEAERLQRLVSDLLDFARPHDPQLYPVPLARVVDDALDAARQDPSFAERRPKLLVEVPGSLPEALTDAVLLRRAVVNVLVNAFQHVPVGGEVRVEARLATEGWLRLRIANDGPPVRPEIATRLFEPFVTARATGTGLGLAVVRRIVEELRGRVQLDDGTPVAFSIWLPIALEERLSKP